MSDARASLFQARRIYVASSWRNDVQPVAVEMFRQLGHEVYDFRNPRPGDNGFHWSDIDPDIARRSSTRSRRTASRATSTR
jgi:hypothetical protein